ncbi:hypothetical protein B0T26DRAFT_700629, partial [Lasiosphaeria miniovina]
MQGFFTRSWCFKVVVASWPLQVFTYICSAFLCQRTHRQPTITHHRKTTKGSQKTVTETPVPNPHLYNIEVTEW